MASKNRRDITDDVKSLEAKGLDASQKAINLARLAEKTKQTFDSFNGSITNESQLVVNRAIIEVQQSLDSKHHLEIEKVQNISTQLDEYQNKFEEAISANTTDIGKISLLEQQANLKNVDSSALQEAKQAKQQEIEFLSQIDIDIERTQEQLKQHLTESRQRRKRIAHEYKNKDLSPTLDCSSEVEDSFNDGSTTEYKGDSLLDPILSDPQINNIREWGKLFVDLVELSESIAPFINKTISLATLSVSMFTGLMGSPQFTQAIDIGVKVLRSSMKIIVKVYPNLIDLNNQTLGSDWSTLPDESIFKIIADISEKNDKFHFGDEDIAELINWYASNEEEKDRERKREQQNFDEASSSTEAPPPPPKEPSAFAKSLSYGHLYGKEPPTSFGENDRGGTLQALLPDGTNSECYINYSIDTSGRIKIGDIQVSPNHQRQGIATLLFKDLESRVPTGTTFFFVENQSPEFWTSTGFQFNDRTKEYYKTKS
jgi:hypothetical protein